jgi:hypothetical protein
MVFSVLRWFLITDSRLSFLTVDRGDDVSRAEHSPPPSILNAATDELLALYGTPLAD